MAQQRLYAIRANYNPNYFADHTAVVFGDRRLTYSDLNQNINKLSNVMTGLGIKKSAKVATV